MVPAVAVVSIVIFVVALWAFGIVQAGTASILTVQDAIASMRKDGFDDAAREKVAREASMQLMRAFMSIVIRGTLAFVAAFLPIWLASLAGIASMADVIAYLSRWDVIAVGSLVIIVGYILWGRR